MKVLFPGMVHPATRRFSLGWLIVKHTSLFKYDLVNSTYPHTRPHSVNKPNGSLCQYLLYILYKQLSLK